MSAMKMGMTTVDEMDRGLCMADRASLLASTPAVRIESPPSVTTTATHDMIILRLNVPHAENLHPFHPYNRRCARP